MTSLHLRIKEGLLDLICDAVSRYDNAMEQLEAQSALAAVSNFDFVWALRPTAQKISERTGKRYCDILMEAKDRLLAGEDVADTLWYFDSQLMIRN